MSPRSARASEMAARSQGAREKAAAELFDPSRVLEAIEMAAGEGRTWLRIKPKQRIGFEDTKAWRRLLRRLAELDYVARLEWVMPIPGEDEGHKRAELVIGWGGNTVGMMSPLELLAIKEWNMAPTDEV